MLGSPREGLPCRIPATLPGARGHSSATCWVLHKHEGLGDTTAVTATHPLLTSKRQKAVTWATLRTCSGRMENPGPALSHTVLHPSGWRMPGAACRELEHFGSFSLQPANTRDCIQDRRKHQSRLPTVADGSSLPGHDPRWSPPWDCNGLDVSASLLHYTQAHLPGILGAG